MGQLESTTATKSHLLPGTVVGIYPITTSKGQHSFEGNHECARVGLTTFCVSWHDQIGVVADLVAAKDTTVANRPLSSTFSIRSSFRHPFPSSMYPTCERERLCRCHLAQNRRYKIWVNRLSYKDHYQHQKEKINEQKKLNRWDKHKWKRVWARTLVRKLQQAKLPENLKEYRFACDEVRLSWINHLTSRFGNGYRQGTSCRWLPKTISPKLFSLFLRSGWLLPFLHLTLVSQNCSTEWIVRKTQIWYGLDTHKCPGRAALLSIPVFRYNRRHLFFYFREVILWSFRLREFIYNITKGTVDGKRHCGRQKALWKGNVTFIEG